MEQTRTCSPAACAAESRCVNDPACSGGGTPTPTCTIDLAPNSASVSVGSASTFIASVVGQDGTVERVDFASGNTSVAAVNPANDTTVVYQTNASGVSVGSTTIRADVIMSGSSRCNDTSNITVITPQPWWQVIDSDVATNGSLNSSVPVGLYFGLGGLGGYPGVPSYAGSSNLTSLKVSSRGWISETVTLTRNNAKYGYRYFKRLVPQDVVFNDVGSIETPGSFFESGGVVSRGYTWYLYDGSSTGLDLTISSDMNIGNRKVVLFVDSANLYLNGRINLTDGEGFFMVIVGNNTSGTKGDIIISPTLGGGATPHLEGMFVADSEIKTGEGTAALHVRGSMAALDGILFQRDLGSALNQTTPSEVFEYAPDLIMLFPPKLMRHPTKWVEVVP